MKFRLHYRVANNGDGSASVQFFGGKAAAEAAEEKDPEGWGESTVGSVVLVAEGDGLGFADLVYDETAKKYQRVVTPLKAEKD